MSSLKENVDFSRIRYANCWEDADMLLAAVDIRPADRVLIIASAGDNALAALSHGPASVRAIDLSPAQLHLCALKQTAFDRLDYDELLLLLGICGPATTRWNLYRKLREFLGTGAIAYWDARRAVIESGIVHSGKFEQYFRMFRSWLLPLVHSKASVRRLLESKTDAAQSAFFEDHWNTGRWRALMGLFFSKAVMGKYGRDPRFLRHVALDVPQYIRKKSEAHLRLSAATSNPFLHYIMTGTFGPQLPFYLREESFAGIRQYIGRLHLSEEDMDAAVMSAPYEIYAASNIFEYMSADMFSSLAHRWSGAIPPRSRIAYWNLMVPRSFESICPQDWTLLPAPPLTDNGFFYSRFLTEEKT